MNASAAAGIPVLRIPSMSETGIGPVELPQATVLGQGAAAPVGFGELLGGAVDSVAQVSQAAEAKAADFARGALDDVHGTMISTKEAEITLKLVGSVRNKLLDAFHELWRISA